MKKSNNNNLIIMLNVVFTVVLVANVMPPLFEVDNTWDSSGSELTPPDILIEENLAPNLIPGAEQDYEYKNEQYGLKVYFQSEYSAESADLLKVTGNGHWLSWQPSKMTIGTGALNIAEAIPTATCSDGIMNGNRIEYPGLYTAPQTSEPIVNDEYLIQPDKLKHNIILTERSAIQPNLQLDSKTTLDFYGQLRYPNTLRLFTNAREHTSDFTTASSIEVRDAYNNRIFILPAPYAYELAKPSEMVECQYYIEFLTPELGLDTRVINIAIQTPYEWLKAPTRSYPVVIDPTIILPKDASQGKDSFIMRGDHTASDDYNNSNFGKEIYLRITLDVTDKEYVSRILLWFDVSGIDPIAEIKSANLKLYFQGPESSLTIAAYRVTKSWVEGTGVMGQLGDDGVCWNTSDGNPLHVWSPGGDRDIKEYANTDVTTKNQWYSWDIAELVQEWVDEKYENHGVMLVGKAGQDDVEMQFSSSQGGSYPRLDINYNTPPALNPDFDGYIHAKPEDAPVHYLDLNKLFVDPDSDDNLNFQIWNGNIFKELGIYSNEFINISIQNNESLKFIPRANRFGTDTIRLKALDKTGSELEHQLEIKVNQVSDPPKIIKIDNVQVRDGWNDVVAQEAHSKNTTITIRDNDYYFGTRHLFDLSEDYIYPLINAKYSDDIIPIPPNVPTKLRTAFNNKGSQLTTSAKLFNMSYETNTGWGEKENWKLMDELWWEILDGKDSYRLLVFDFTLKIYENDDLYYEFSSEKAYNLAFTNSWRDGKDFINGQEQVSLKFRPTNANVGEVYVNVTATDNGAENHTVNLRFEVMNSNNPPINPSIICLKDGKPCTEFTTADTVRLEGSADDPDFYIPEPIERLSYEWHSDLQGEVGTTQNLETKLIKGEHEMTLKVIDSEGEFIKTSIMINIKNQPSIDNENASNDYVDVADDVLSYSYRQHTANRTSTFDVELGKFRNIDIVALGSNRDDYDLIIYLTVDGIISNLTGYEYEIFLVKPFHMEAEHDVRDKYKSSIPNELYHPEKFEYYAKFTFEDGSISEEDPSTLIIIEDLGDLEAGDASNQPLEADFGVFAIAKYNSFDPSGDPLKHDFAYDSAGHGSVDAPTLTTKEDPTDVVEELGENFTWIIVGVAVVIVIIIVAAIFLRKRKESGTAKSAKDDGVIYDTSELEVLAPGQVAHRAPPPSTGTIPQPAQQLQPIAPPPRYQVPPPRAPVPLEPGQQVQAPQSQPQPQPQPQQPPVQSYPQQVPGQVPGQPQQQRQQLKRY